MVDKYDRQLRLWGAGGQKLLAESHLLVLGSSALATETLKNLVLPGEFLLLHHISCCLNRISGVGKFTIVDNKNVSHADIKNNFFVTADSLNQSRAKVTSELISELNPDVTGFYIHPNTDTCSWFKDLKKEDILKYSLVIVSGMVEMDMLSLEEKVYSLNMNVPLMFIRTYGFMGECRVVTMCHCVIESKPSPAGAIDIRLANPFPALADYARSITTATMDQKQYKHTPYVVLLLKYAEEWKKNHGLPTSTNDKKAFREGIRLLARQPWGMEENLAEAYDNAYMAYTPRGVPQDVSNLFSIAQSEHHNQSNSPFNTKFWIMVQALHLFVSNEGQLPLSGSLPDMTATTELFVELQGIYRHQALLDLTSMTNRVNEIIAKVGTSISLSDAELQIFCKNAYDLQYYHTRRLREEYTSLKSGLQSDIEESIEDFGIQSPIYFYFMRRACDLFFKNKGAFPSDSSDAMELLELCESILDQLGISNVVPVEISHAKEMIRYCGCELHNVAALIGGVAAQEAVKLVTHQYGLLNNTYLFNGITCVGSVFSF